MSRHFKEFQTELSRMGYEYVSRNTNGWETWEHGNGHSLVINPSLNEAQHRNMLRFCQKAVGVQVSTNKRKVTQIKERQGKERDDKRQEMQARQAWLEARIRDLEMAAALERLTAKQEKLLQERLRELAQIKGIMSQIPTGA